MKETIWSDKSLSIIFPTFFEIDEDIYKSYNALESRTFAVAKLFANLGIKVNLLAPRGSRISHKNITVLSGNYQAWDGRNGHPYELEKDLVLSNLDELKKSDAILEDSHFGYLKYLKSLTPDEFSKVAYSFDHHPDQLSSLPNYPTNIICVSKWQMTVLRERFKNLEHNFYQAYSGLILENYPDYDLKDKEDNLYLYLARFSTVKSPHIILEVAQENPNDNFVLLGDSLFSNEPHYARKLKQLADSMDNVKIIFNASYDEKIDYLKRATGILHPGSWCIPDYETILTNDGMVKISDISVGDYVLTHDGTFQKVLNKFIKEYNGELIRIHPRYSTSFDVTPEHKVMTKEGYKHACELTMNDILLRTKSPKGETIIAKNLLNDVEFPNAKLIKKQTLSGENIIFRRYRTKFKKSYEYYGEQNRGHPFPENLTIDDDFIHLCAAYICEGSTTQDMIAFAFGKKEYIDVWERISERLMCSYRIRDKGGWYEVFLNSRVYPQLMEKWFGKGAKNKHLPLWIWELSDKHKKMFITYLINYDGHIEKKTEIKNYTTLSKTLAYQIKLLVQSVGINCAVTKAKGYDKTFNGKTKFYEGCYRLRFNDGKTNFLIREENDEYVGIFKLQKKSYKGIVYDIEVEKNHNFILNDTVVSNSEPLGWDTLEGLYFGCKALSFDRGASREIYKNEKHGLIIPFSNSEENNIEFYKRSFKKLKTMKINPQTCRDRIISEFDFKRKSFPVYKRVLFENE